jgi:hypothetical protein
MVGHPVLDAAGHIQVLRFGKNPALLAFVSKIDLKQGSVPDHSL